MRVAVLVRFHSAVSGISELCNNAQPIRRKARGRFVAEVIGRRGSILLTCSPVRRLGFSTTNTMEAHDGTVATSAGRVQGAIFTTTPHLGSSGACCDTRLTRSPATGRFTRWLGALRQTAGPPSADCGRSRQVDGGGWRLTDVVPPTSFDDRARGRASRRL